MIIELFGSPGSGKTYAINQIHPGAIKEGKNKKDLVLDPIKRVIKKSISLTPYAFAIRRKIRGCIVGCKIETPKYKPVEINDFIWNISMLGSVYRFSRRNVYMDEGIVHRTISMCINYGIDKEICENIIKNLSYVIKDVNVIYLSVPIDECMKSIIERNRHEHSIDELKGEKLSAFLRSYEEYCNYISNVFGFIKVDRNKISDIDFQMTFRSMS